MCCRYWMEESPELREIVLEMNRSPLADKWRKTRGIKTGGEIFPTDVVPVIAPDRSGRRAVFPMKWGFSIKMPTPGTKAGKVPGMAAGKVPGMAAGATGQTPGTVAGATGKVSGMAAGSAGEMLRMTAGESLQQGGRSENAARILLMNARTETAGQKPSFRESWRRRRCIVPASWYFEWEHLKRNDGQTGTGEKYMLQPKNSGMTWLCGLYRIENGLPEFVILTREPGDEIRFIHDRMPLILPERCIDDWIRPGTRPEDLLPEALTEMVYEKADGSLDRNDL